MAPPVIVKHSYKSASFRIRRRYFREHANVFKVEKQKFPRACKYLLRCAQPGLWVSVAYQAALTNHRDFQLLPLMDEPVFQSGAIDVLAESGHWSSGQSSQIELHGGLEVPSYISFQFSTVHPFFHLISCTPCGKWLIKSVGKFLFPEWTFNSRFTSYSSSSFDD